MADQQYQPIDVAVALSIYFHNVSASEIIASLCLRFDDEPELIEHILGGGPVEITRLPPKAAKIVVDLALKAYGRDAVNRNQANGVRD